MLSISNSISIDKPLSDVFAFVSDQGNNPKWNYYVRSVEKINDEEGIGAEYLQIRKKDKQKFNVIVFKENERIIIQSLPGQRPSVRRDLRFDGDEKQTTIHDQIDFKVPLPKFLSSLILKGPQKGVKQNLAKLKILLETGHVVLQDGREINY
ncbi:SRPBCC family protein [Ekhidna sp.]|uniref:SRPBCC family protein n=1 Tax=Ekhidna sp. TaxID=2608089 RepID=UPI003B50B23C